MPLIHKIPQFFAIYHNQNLYSAKKHYILNIFPCDQALDFAEHYRADSGDAEVWDLPKMGINGNSHFMFQEMNNKQIADLIENWLKERKL